MDAIFNYLDNMFAHLPKTEEVKRAKTELGQMMEDKYNQLRAEGRSDNEAVGQVISEFGNLSELAEELGISNQVQQASSEDNFVYVTAAEGETFIEKSKKAANMIGGGVAAIMLGVISVIFFSSYAEGIFSQVLGGDEPNKVYLAVGLGLLFILIAFAVYLFVMTGLANEKYKIFDKKVVKLDPHNKMLIQKAKENHRPVLLRKISIGVGQILLAVAALTVAGVLFEDNEAVLVCLVCLLLLIIGISVWLFISGGAIQNAYDKLLNEGDYTVERRKSESVVQRWASPYWTLIVVVYLAWSFITSSWDKTWIIWPIAGILFGLISAIVHAATSNKE
ncbi:MAG: hypothetical protein GX884_00295 [Chloroflexi bacterium]|jgi:hypothetical protein|nr:hypothetical protein [Chloroflexota bacterium]